MISAYSPIRKFGLNIILVALLITTGCSRESARSHRIVSLAPNWTHTVVSIGAFDELMGVTRYCIFPDSIPDLVEAGRLVSVGGFLDIDMALIDSLQPDVVLTATGMQRRYHPHFDSVGIAYVHMEETNLAEVYEKILQLGGLIGRNGEARALVDSIKQELTSIGEEYADMPKVTVYYEINYYYKCVPGADSYMKELIELIGGIPVFSQRPGIAPPVTWEEVVEINPEVILIPWWATAGEQGPHYEPPLAGNGTTTPKRVASRPGADLILAVQNGRVRFIDSAKTKQAGPQIPTAARLFAEAIHAEGNMERLELNEVPEDIGNQ